MTGTSLITLFHGEALFRAGQQATHFYLVTEAASPLSIKPGWEKSGVSSLTSCLVFPKFWRAATGI